MMDVSNKNANLKTPLPSNGDIAMGTPSNVSIKSNAGDTNNIGNERSKISVE